jgi:hypothetical protein
MRLYRAPFEAVAISVQVDFWEVVLPSDTLVELVECHIGQSSDAGDAEAEMAPISFVTGYTTSGSGGTTITPAPQPGDAAFSGTVEANNTTLASGGTPRLEHADTFHWQAGFCWVPTPESRILLPVSSRLVVRLGAAPADAVTVSGILVLAEAGS